MMCPLKICARGTGLLAPHHGMALHVIVPDGKTRRKGRLCIDLRGHDRIINFAFDKKKKRKIDREIKPNVGIFDLTLD